MDEVQPTDQAPQEGQPTQQVRVHIDERNMDTAYTNSFRTNASPEEVILTFGLNQVVQQNETGADRKPGEMVFQANQRVVMNYYAAKRLAIALGQVIQRYEQQFGELKLNVQDRRV